MAKFLLLHVYFFGLLASRLTLSLFVEFTWRRHSSGTNSSNMSNLHNIELDLSSANISLESQIIYQCYVYDFTHQECHGLYDFVQETVISSYPTVLIEGVNYLIDNKTIFKVIDIGKFHEFLESKTNSWLTSFTFTSTRYGEVLESLAYKYGTDKSKDDHGYTNIYASIFNQYYRHNALNITELGVSFGQSLQMWNSYLPHSAIYGIDIGIATQIIDRINRLNRVRLIIHDAYNASILSVYNISNYSMDIVIDDAIHTRKHQEEALHIFWKTVKTGGYYIIEDIDSWIHTKGGCGLDFLRHTSKFLHHFTRTILNENIAFFVNTAIGHRNWTAYKTIINNHIGYEYIVNFAMHNSYMVIIRKRKGSIPPFHMVSSSYESSLNIQPINLENKSDGEFLEYLSYKYGSVKGRDDYNFASVYACLFDQVIDQNVINNILEISEHKQEADISAKLWNEYFYTANVYILFPSSKDHDDDLNKSSSCYEHSETNEIIDDKKIYMHEYNNSGANKNEPFGSNISVLFPSTSSDDTNPSPLFDIIIDSGSTAFRDQEARLNSLWNYLKPSGHYIIENIDALKGGLVLEDNPESMQESTKKILFENNAFLINTAIGHRDLNLWKKVYQNLDEDMLKQLANDDNRYRLHNMYMLVIRKRVGEQPEFQINLESKSMRFEGLIMEL